MRFAGGNIGPHFKQSPKECEGGIRFFFRGVLRKEYLIVRCKLRIMAAATDRNHNRKMQDGHAPIIAACSRIPHKIDVRAMVDQIISDFKPMQLYGNLKRRLPIILLWRLFCNAIYQFGLSLDQMPYLVYISFPDGFE